MRKLKVCRIGKSLGIVLPRDVVRRMRTSEGDYLVLTETSGGGYQLSSCDVALEKKLQKAEKVFGRYRNALRAVASEK